MFPTAIRLGMASLRTRQRLGLPKSPVVSPKRRPPSGARTSNKVKEAKRVSRNMRLLREGEEALSHVNKTIAGEEGKSLKSYYVSKTSDKHFEPPEQARKVFKSVPDFPGFFRRKYRLRDFEEWRDPETRPKELVITQKKPRRIPEWRSGPR